MQGSLDLPTLSATEAAAARLAETLSAGDAVLLTGPIGAGKTAFARAAIRHLQRHHGQIAEEVPSPSYTLVQTYEAGPLTLWHVDLYRLDGAADTVELGLDAAFEDGVVLLEWPERLGAAAPPRALHLDLAPAADSDARHLRFSAAGPGWDAAIRALTARAPA